MNQNNRAETGAKQNGQPRIISSQNDTGFLPDEMRKQLNQRVSPEWIAQWKDHPLFPKMVIGKSLDVKPHENREFFKCFRSSNFMLALRDFVENPRPVVKTFEQLSSEVIIRPPTIFEGLLKMQERLVLGGPSKSCKTWALINAGISAACGVDWLEFKAAGVFKVLYLNFELHETSFRDRVRWIAENRGLNMELINKNFHSLCLRNEILKPEAIVEMVIDMTKNLGLSLIILDPTYKMLGDLKENDNGDMAKLVQHFIKLNKSLGVAVAFAAHFPKGNPVKKEAQDRIAGGGVIVRDADAIITLTPPSKKQFEELTKSFKTASPKYEGLNESTVQTLMVCPDHGTSAEWKVEAIKNKRISEKTFYRHIQDLDPNFVHKDGDGKGARYSKTDKGREVTRQYMQARFKGEDQSTEPRRFGKVHVVEFVLRDSKDIDPFFVEFKDLYHRRIATDFVPEMDDQGDDKSQDGDNKVECSARLGPEGPFGTWHVQCPDCKETAEAYHENPEGDKEPGSGLGKALDFLKQACTCNDGRFFKAVVTSGVQEDLF
jgi:AAA domain